MFIPPIPGDSSDGWPSIYTIYSWFTPSINHLLIGLVVSTNPYEKWWSSSVGMMIIPKIWKNKKNVPNHQPVIY